MPANHTSTDTISTAIFRYINTRIWSKAGHFNKALSKGPKTTTWIWNLHSNAHDFDIQQSSMAVITRKVFSSNSAHLSLVFFWISGMLFHSAYFSNYDIWLKDRYHWSQATPAILNDHTAQGSIRITSGIFQLWRSEGIISNIHLKYATLASLIGCIICITASYFHMHNQLSLFESAISIHHLSATTGLGVIAFSGHQIHISLPANPLLDSGTTDYPFCVLFSLPFIPSSDLIEIILPGFRIGPLVNFALYLPGVSILGSTAKLLNPSSRSVFLGQVVCHHFTTGVVFNMTALIGYISVNYSRLDLLQPSSWVNN